MNNNRIEIGDIVSVSFTSAEGWYPKLEVVSLPQATGDCWILQNPDTGQIIYIQSFETMALMQKGRKK